MGVFKKLAQKIKSIKNPGDMVNNARTRSAGRKEKRFAKREARRDNRANRRQKRIDARQGAKTDRARLRAENGGGFLEKVGDISGNLLGRDEARENPMINARAMSDEVSGLSEQPKIPYESEKLEEKGIMQNPLMLVILAGLAFLIFKKKK